MLLDCARSHDVLVADCLTFCVERHFFCPVLSFCSSCRWLGALTYLFALAMLLLNLRYCSLAVRVLMLPRFFLCVAAVDVISIAPAVFVLGSSRCQQEVPLIHNRRSELPLMELCCPGAALRAPCQSCAQKLKAYFPLTPRGGRVSGAEFQRNFAENGNVLCLQSPGTGTMRSGSTVRCPGPGGRPQGQRQQSG